jgi:protein-S-isoprenylcysteine O-methyltransferase Ste14
MHVLLYLPYILSIVCWFALEVALGVRDAVRQKARQSPDRGTRAMVGLCIGVSIFMGTLMRRWVPALNTPIPAAFAVAGVVVIWIGLAVRVWAVRTLGGWFSTWLQADADQALITRGPYRWVRHPSYTGLLLIAVGFGLGGRNWLALLVCVVVPLLGLLPRIAVEESELTGVLGEQYRSYQRTTWRFVPGVW